MKKVEQHLEEILGTVRPLGVFALSLPETHGCVLAEQVVSPIPLPTFDTCAADGYAVRSDDLAGASEDRPLRVHVVGDVAAGSWRPQRVAPGAALRVVAGAPVPGGADAVVPESWTDGGIAAVQIRRAPAPGQHIRREAEDLAAGTVVAEPGITITAAQLALFAAVGRNHALVQPTPRAIVVSAGDELVEPGGELRPGKVVDANSYALVAAVQEAGGVAYRAGIAPDDPERLRALLDDNLVRGDLVITSGGVSGGERDVMRKALGKLGTVRFEQVAMQPGSAHGFGVIGPDDTPIFCLPGDPVSALVGFEVFVRPALRRMAAHTPLHRPIVRAALAEPITSPEGRRQYRRAWFERRDGEPVVRPVGGEGSHLVAGLAASNALIVLPEYAVDVPAGAKVDVMLLEQRER